MAQQAINTSINDILLSYLQKNSNNNNFHTGTVLLELFKAQYKSMEDFYANTGIKLEKDLLENKSKFSGYSKYELETISDHLLLDKKAKKNLDDIYNQDKAKEKSRIIKHAMNSGPQSENIIGLFTHLLSLEELSSRDFYKKAGVDLENARSVGRYDAVIKNKSRVQKVLDINDKQMNFISDLIEGSRKLNHDHIQSGHKRTGLLAKNNAFKTITRPDKKISFAKREDAKILLAKGKWEEINSHRDRDGMEFNYPHGSRMAITVPIRMRQAISTVIQETISGVLIVPVDNNNMKYILEKDEYKNLIDNLKGKTPNKLSS